MKKDLFKIINTMYSKTRSKYFTDSTSKCSDVAIDEQKSKKKKENLSDDEEKTVKKVKGRKSVSFQNWEPKNWEEILENIKKMRETKDAPVDSMGAEKCYDQHGELDKDKRFQILVSLMLSSQTKDQITHAVMLKLRDNGLSVNKILDMSGEELGELIRPVGFWRKKTENIKKVAQILNDQYDGDIPNTLESLQSLPGVGPKMSNLAMKIAWNKITGIAVDTHVHRICNRLGWVKKQTKIPEETRVQLESWLPKEKWDDINLLLVGFGQTICKPINPNCRNCLNNKLCPSSNISF